MAERLVLPFSRAEIARRVRELAASLALPVAGLMSPEPAEKVGAAMDRLCGRARDLGSPFPNPFAVLSFLALPVIPELRLTDRGLVDVGKGELVPLAAE